MPVRIIDSSDRPTYVEKPDIRFATTFLSHEYRDYSVEGEALMDKMTGELFIKRPEDGRVLSFEQNKKYAYDQVLELRVLLTNNEEFTYPKNSTDAFYVSTNYDLVTINKEVVNDVLKTENTVISVEGSSDIDLRNTLSFNISGYCNGFFCCPITRDCDKMAVEILSSMYNNIVQNYEGSDNKIRSEQSKFTSIQKWEDSDIILTYTADITENGVTKSYTLTDYIRFNEQMGVLIPTDVLANYPYGYDSIKITIKKLEYYKMHFVMGLSKSITGIDDMYENIKEYLCPDGKIYVNYLNIVSFVDSYKDIRLLGNETNVGFLDIPYVRRYMTKLAKLKKNSDFIQSTARPSEDDWGANAVWAEMLRDVKSRGEVTYRNSETDLKELEILISKNDFDIVNINPDFNAVNDIWIENLGDVEVNTEESDTNESS
jgi:hypothetical protein